MKIRWLILVLCVALLVPAVLSGCKSKSNEQAIQEITNESSKDACTLTLWVVTENEDGVDAETTDLITTALNRITNSKYKTKLVLRYLTQDEYRTTLDRTIRDYIDTRATTVTVETTASTEEGETFAVETETNADGMMVVKYPDLLANQVDIVLIQGEEMYLDYIHNGWLADLNAQMGNSDGKQIKSFVNNALISAAKREGGIYAIPNNNTLGEYTFMLLNKELMKETSMDALYEQGKIKGLFNNTIYSYLETIAYKIKTSGDTSIVPIDATYEQCLNLLAHFWSIDPDTLENEDGFSVLGYYYSNPLTVSRSTAIRFDSLFANDDFNDAFLKLNEYRLASYFGTATEGQKSALKIATGSYTDYQTYLDDSSEYYPVIIRNPSIEADDVYGSMFGVCSKTTNLSRCMEIIACLNTNATFRNLLQYGIEGVNYRLETEIVNDVTVSRVIYLEEDHPYHMNVFKTGNAYIAYPMPGMADDIWDDGKAQNLAVTGADPMLGVSIRTIAQNSADTSATLNPGTTGYAYSYASGYSKEILAQNLTISDWIAQVDAIGPGTYFLQTTEVASGQNINSVYYVYNNQYAGTSYAYDQDGVITVAIEGTSEGYHLGILKVNARKSASIGIAATLNGEPANAVTKTRYSIIDVDLMHTGIYDVRVSANIAKTSVRPNEAVWSWVQSVSEEKGTLQMLRSVKELDNGRNKYTFLVYSPDQQKEYSVKLNPMGTADSLTLDVAFDNRDDEKASDVDYAIWLVTVEADASITDVTFRLTHNGVAETPVITEPEKDPCFTYCGTMDTELVRYISELNDTVEKLILSCTSIDELRTIVAELKLLLTPQTNLLKIPADKKLEHLTVILEKFNKTDLNYALVCATSTKTVKHMDLGYNDEGDTVTTTVDRDKDCGEDYVLLDSPYKLYNEWLISNGYIKK